MPRGIDLIAVLAGVAVILATLYISHRRNVEARARSDALARRLERRSPNVALRVAPGERSLPLRPIRFSADGVDVVVTGCHTDARLLARAGVRWQHLVLVRCELVGSPMTPLAAFEDVYFEDCTFIYDGMEVSSGEWVAFVAREGRRLGGRLRH